MPRSAFTEAHAAVAAHLLRWRRERNVTQVELAQRLGKAQQFVSLVERGDRRVDVVEFYAFVRALGMDPGAAFLELIRTMPGSVEI